MDDSVYAKRLRVAGNVAPGSIKRQGSHVEFTLVEQDLMLPVVYTGTEAPPDTFMDNAQALAEGSYGRDGVFHAKMLQAKCASKYAPKDQQQGTPSPGDTAHRESSAQFVLLRLPHCPAKPSRFSQNPHRPSASTKSARFSAALPPCAR